MAPNLNAPYPAFLNDPDQAQREQELRTFIGPKADKFMKTYSLLRTAQQNSLAGKRPSIFQQYGFTGVVFFIGPVWYFYRKMWVVGSVITAIQLVLGFLPVTARLGLPISVILMSLSNRTYVQHAIAKIQSMRDPSGHVDPTALALAGGVSKTAGWIGGILYGLLFLFALFSIYVVIKTGQPIQ